MIKMMPILAILGLILFIFAVFTKGIFSSQAIYGLLLLLVAWIGDVEEKLEGGKNGRNKSKTSK